MIRYVIRQGDHLPKLAFRHGFDAELIWNHSSNAELRELRQDPCLLAPGDVLQFPARVQRGQPFSPGTVNRYVARPPRVDVSLIMHDQLGVPLPDEPYFIEGLGTPDERTTGPGGEAAFSVPVLTREVTLHFHRRNRRVAVRIGDLDPLAEVSGVAGRLANLRYLDHPTAFSHEQLADALMAFQSEQGLPVTGTLDDSVKEVLEEAHAGRFVSGKDIR